MNENCFCFSLWLNFHSVSQGFYSFSVRISLQLPPDQDQAIYLFGSKLRKEVKISPHIKTKQNRTFYIPFHGQKTILSSPSRNPFRCLQTSYLNNDRRLFFSLYQLTFFNCLTRTVPRFVCRVELSDKFIFNYNLYCEDRQIFMTVNFPVCWAFSS